MEVPEWQEEATDSTMEIIRLRGEAMGSEQQSPLPGFPLCERAVASADLSPYLTGRCECTRAEQWQQHTVGGGIIPLWSVYSKQCHRRLRWTKKNFPLAKPMKYQMLRKDEQCWFLRPNSWGRQSPLGCVWGVAAFHHKVL